MNASPSAVTLTLALFAIIPGSLIGVATLLTAIATFRKSKALVVKTDEIHKMTNGNLQQLNTSLQDANNRIAYLEGSLAKLVEQRKHD